jgi:hypothetical protein
MTRAGRQRVAVVAGVLALLILAFWQWRSDARATAGTLLDMPPPAIQRISLSIGAAPAMHYEQRGGHWWRVDGVPQAADDGRLAELAATAAAPVASWRATADFDLARIGLSPPQAVLRLDGQTLEFGEVAAIGPLRYVRVGDRVALVPARYAPRPPTGHVRQAGS